MKRESEVAQSCPTLSDPMDCSSSMAPPSMGFSRQKYLEYQANWALEYRMKQYPIMMEKSMAPHSSTLAWKTPWMEEPGGLQSMGLRLHFHFSFSCIGEGNGNPLQCSCLENPRDGKPGGLPSMGSHRVGHD